MMGTNHTAAGVPWDGSGWMLESGQTSAYGLYKRQGLRAAVCLVIFMANAGEGSVLRQR